MNILKIYTFYVSFFVSKSTIWPIISTQYQQYTVI